MDVQAILKRDNPRELLELWNAAPDHRRWQSTLDSAIAENDTAGVDIARGALAAVDGAVALDSLRANLRIVELLNGWRWFVIEQAREEGASWADIGDALGTSRQSAWEWYRRHIETQETHVPDLHDAVRGRAALGDPAS